MLWFWHKFRYTRLGTAYNINIILNTVEYGLRIPHIAQGVIINCRHMGHHCLVNAGALIGKKSNDKLADIGNFVEIVPGTKVIGDVTIGDHSIVAPNAVVTKSMPSNSVIAGVPAKVIKKRD